MEEARRKWPSDIRQQKGKEHRHHPIRDQERPAMQESVVKEENDQTCQVGRGDDRKKQLPLWRCHVQQIRKGEPYLQPAPRLCVGSREGRCLLHQFGPVFRLHP